MPEPAFRPIGTVPREALRALFNEEADMWSERLRWNFEPTRRRLESAHGEGTLNGLVSVDDIGPCAYATYALDGRHAIVGSFFSSARARAQGLEDVLVRGVLRRVSEFRPEVIDCQTLFSSAPGLKEPFRSLGFASASRRYMTIERETWLALPPPSFRSPATTQAVNRQDVRGVGRLIFTAHEGSREQDASSSFDTISSCDKILRQIMLDEVCGPFDAFSSRRVEHQGETVSASLVTWPLEGVAHISEVATLPSYRRRGFARRCLLETLSAVFDRDSTATATLSVTSSNLAAISLYESIGFKTRIHYESHVLRGRRW